MPRPTYTPLPAAPNIGDPNFATEADAFLGALPTHATYLETLADWLQQEFYSELDAADTAAAPALRWTGDPDTGLLHPAADIVAVTAGGAERLRITTAEANFTVQPKWNGAPLFGEHSQNMELARGLSGDRSTHLDFHAQDAVDFSARIQRAAGVNGAFNFTQTGVGAIELTTLGNLNLNCASVRVVSNSPNMFFSDSDFVRAGANNWKVAGNEGVFRLHPTDTGGTYHSEGMFVNSDTNGVTEYRFYTSNVERARINGTGLKVGTSLFNPGNGNTTTGVALDENGRVYFNSASTPTLHAGRNNDGQVAQWNRAGATVGNVSVTASSTTYNTSSDYRLKENLEPTFGASDIIAFLNPTFFTFKETGEWMDGFIAHEVQAVIPGAVTGEKDGMRDEEYEVAPAEYDAEGNETKAAVMGVRSVPDYQGIDHSRIVPYVVKALQEQMARADAAEARADAAETRLNLLESRILALETA